MAQTRITAGQWRGRLIDTPAGLAVRPTRSLVRQALFDILGGRVAGARMLDLYAGAGTIGFEALSRGAAAVTFVEARRDMIALIATTADRFGCRPRCRTVGADVLRWLRRSGEEVASADICYVDAPYRDPALDTALALLGESPPGLVVCEHHRSRDIAERIGGLERYRDARHGLTTLSFLRRMNAQTDPHT